MIRPAQPDLDQGVVLLLAKRGNGSAGLVLEQPQEHCSAGSDRYGKTKVI